VLLEAKADVKQAANLGHTPLFFAAWKGYTEAASLLILHGAANRDDGIFNSESNRDRQRQ
jgi:ankyrin repeat protein